MASSREKKTLAWTFSHQISPPVFPPSLHTWLTSIPQCDVGPLNGRPQVSSWDPKPVIHAPPLYPMTPADAATYRAYADWMLGSELHVHQMRSLVT